jgi:hypothetical protein
LRVVLIVHADAAYQLVSRIPWPVLYSAPHLAERQAPSPFRAVFQ